MIKLEYDLLWIRKLLQNFEDYGKTVTDADINILKIIADDLQAQVEAYNAFIDSTKH